MQLYEHSGAVPLGGVVISGIVGFLVAGVLGVAYAFGMVYIPLIYINFLLTIAFGCAIGFAVGWSAKQGRIRNSMMVGLLGFGFGLFGLYVEWATHPLVMLGFEEGFFAFDPQLLYAWAMLLYENGSWGLTEGENVKGIFLVVIWIVEAAVILVAATFLARLQIQNRPFCETCQHWTTPEEDVKRLLPTSAGDETERLLSGDLSVLPNMPRANASMPIYLRLDLATCPSCKQSNFLTIEAVSESVDKDGKTQKNTETLIRQMWIAEKDVLAVRQAGREVSAEELDELLGSSEESDIGAEPEAEGGDAGPPA